MNTSIHFLSYLAHFFLEWEMSHTKVVKKIKTHILFSVTFFFLENHAVYEIMWKDIVERGMPQMTVWRMRFTCWIPKATSTLRLCHTHSFLTTTMAARTLFAVTLYVYYLCCVCVLHFRWRPAIKGMDGEFFIFCGLKILLKFIFFLFRESK